MMSSTSHALAHDDDDDDDGADIQLPDFSVCSLCIHTAAAAVSVC